MLHDLASPSSESIFKSWNTAVKLTWNVPRSTYTYIVENLLARNFNTLRNQIYSRYCKFFQNLLDSSSKEVSFLAKIVSHDSKSVTQKNIQLIEKAAGCSPWDCSTWTIKTGLTIKPIPANDDWRISLLSKMLEYRMKEETLMNNTDDLSKMIDSLCAS